MGGRKLARIALSAALGTVSLVAVQPAEATSAWASRTTTVRGTFRVGSVVRTLVAETRIRPVASAPTPPNVDPYGFSANVENVTTVRICNQNGCGNFLQNGICSSTLATLDDEATGQGTIHIVSTKQGCEVDVTASVGNASLPRASADRLESTATAVFADGALIEGSTAEGTDGTVIRSISWFAR